MTPQVIAEDYGPCVVTAQGTFGGGYSQPGSKETLVQRTARALVHELYGQREVHLIAPEWVRQELLSMGYQV